MEKFADGLLVALAPSLEASGDLGVGHLPFAPGRAS